MLAGAAVGAAVGVAALGGSAVAAGASVGAEGCVVALEPHAATPSAITARAAVIRGRDRKVMSDEPHAIGRRHAQWVEVPGCAT